MVIALTSHQCGPGSIHYLHKSQNTPLLPPKNLHRHCFRLLSGHFHVPGEIANNGYAKVLGGNRGVLWDCASSEFSDSASYVPGLRLLVLYSALRGFLRVLRFSPLLENQHLI